MSTEHQHWYAKANDEFSQMASWLQSPLLLAIRLFWGWQFFTDGWAKLHNLARVTDFFVSLGIPAPGLSAHFVSGLEFIGGLMLMLGLATRFMSLLLACNMFVAFYTAERDALFSVFRDPDKFTGADAYGLLFASVLLLVFGAGAISVDHLLRHHFEKKRLERKAQLEATA